MKVDRCRIHCSEDVFHIPVEQGVLFNQRSTSSSILQLLHEHSPGEYWHQPICFDQKSKSLDQLFYYFCILKLDNFTKRV